jgi:surface protein
MNRAFKGCSSLLKLPDISKLNTKNVTDISSLFENCCSLESIPKINKWNTYNLRKANRLFFNCQSLEIIPDISSWKLYNMKEMKDLFKKCSSVLMYPDISKAEINQNVIINNESSSSSSLNIKEKTPSNISDDFSEDSEDIRLISPIKIKEKKEEKEEKTERENENENNSPLEKEIIDTILNFYKNVFMKIKRKHWLKKYPFIEKQYLKLLNLCNIIISKVKELDDSELNPPNLIKIEHNFIDGNYEQLLESPNYDGLNKRSHDFYYT